MFENELKLFQGKKDVIWTDEHISKTLLEAHLDETNDAASRKYEKRLNIASWINNNIQPNSKIIDLGCGPGLYAYELGKMGHNILGIDFNKESINYAVKNKSIQDSVKYKYCNYLKDTIEGKYNAAMMIYCDFGALIPDDQKLLLGNINKFLENNGIFIFDVFEKEAMKNKEGKKDWFLSDGGDFWSKEPYFLMEEIKIFENESTIGKRYYLVNQKNGKIKEYVMWDQYYDTHSISKLLSENGFKIIEIKNELVENHDKTLFIVAKKV